MILKPPPNMPFEINRDSHQADGLVFWVPTVLGDRFSREFFSGDTMRTGSSSWTPTLTKYGWMYTTAANSYRNVPFNAFTGPPYTLFAIGIAPAWTTWQTILSVGDSTQATVNAGNLMSRTTTGKFRFEVSETAGNSAIETTLAWTQNRICMSAGVAVSNSERYVYGANDVGAEKSGIGTTTRTPTAYNQVRVGGKVLSGMSSNWGGTVGDSRIYNRAMSYEEFLQIRENPWELYKPVVPVFYSIPEPAVPKTRHSYDGVWPYAQPINTDYELNTASPQYKDLLAVWTPNTMSTTQYDHKRVGSPMVSGNAPNNYITYDPVMGQVFKTSRVTDAFADGFHSDSVSRLSGLSQVSLSVWYKLTAVLGTAGNYPMIFGKSGGGTLNDREYRLRFELGTRLVWHVSNDGLDPGNNEITEIMANTCPEASEVGRWNHLVGTYDGTNLWLYVNGKYINTGTGDAGPIATTSGKISVGGYHDEISQEYCLNALLTDARIYNRCLTEAEVKEIYNNWRALYTPVVPLRRSIPLDVSIDYLTSSDVTSGTPSFDTSSILEAVFIRPASDVNAGLWTPSTGTTLYETIDEVIPSDVDYMRSDSTPSASPATVGLQAGTDPSESSFHIVRYRYRKSGTGTINLTFALYEGLTVRASWFHNNISDTYTTGEYILSAAEADSITDYTNLRVRVQANEV